MPSSRREAALDRVALVLGGAGLLARELVPALERGGWRVEALGRAECDVTDAGAVARVLQRESPTMVFNCAAYTQVDRAESEPDAAYAVNAVGAGNVARAAAQMGVALVHFSTDYVFDGRSPRPYREEDPTSPLGVYARTKLAGEHAVLKEGGLASIVRTGELYGTGGRSFFSSVLGRVRSGQEVRVVDDQTVGPTWTRDLALQLVTFANSGAPAGIYHATARGEATWYEAACAAVAHLGVDPSAIRRASTAEYGSPAPRPPYSVLAHDAFERLGLYRMRHWRDALVEWLSESHV